MILIVLVLLFKMTSGSCHETLHFKINIFGEKAVQWGMQGYGALLVHWYHEPIRRTRFYKKNFDLLFRTLLICINFFQSQRKAIWWHRWAALIHWLISTRRITSRFFIVKAIWSWCSTTLHINLALHIMLENLLLFFNCLIAYCDDYVLAQWSECHSIFYTQA